MQIPIVNSIQKHYAFYRLDVQTKGFREDETLFQVFRYPGYTRNLPGCMRALRHPYPQRGADDGRTDLNSYARTN
jgi:hypothetical protein